MHISEASSLARNKRGTSKTSRHCLIDQSIPFPVIHETIFCFVYFSYKVPAKGDGVDYVRTEDEVCSAV